AMVLDALLRVEGVRADLAAERDSLLLARELRELFLLLARGQLEQAGLENAQRGVAIAQLRALVLAGDDDARRQMCDAYRGVCRVHALAAGSRRAVDVDPQLVVADRHLDVVDLGRHRHGRE